METNGDTTTPATPLSRALETVRKLRAQLQAQNGNRPIAVVGAGLRFPGGIDDLDSYWNALAEGRDLVDSLPDSRKGPFAAEWEQVPNAGGYLDDVMAFDADFFGLGAEQARGLDPQQRLLLEVAWEALENAGLPADRIDGTRTGSFIGIMSQEYWDWQTGEPDTNWAAGNGHSFAVGRLAYALGLEGPGITVDTACSSTLVSVHLARQALGRQECDVALAGGVNLVLSPRGTRLHHLAGGLAPDGRCKAFDARANGFARSEGCGILVLKRLEDALRDGDRIHAVIAGSAVNQTGRATGFAAPNVLSQITLIESALADAGLSPADIGLVEAHGTGTSIGDTVEMEAIAAALGRKNGGATLAVGCVKTNMGHLESAAGIAALIKSMLCLRHRAVPPLVHFSTLNPLIDLDGTGIILPTSLTPWHEGGGRYASVSAFGAGGTNAHIILGPAEETVRPAGATVPVPGFELAAKTPATIRALAASFHERLARLPEESYPAFAYTATYGRARHKWRARVAASDRASALQALRSLAAGEAASAVTVYEHDQWTDEDRRDLSDLDVLPRAVVDLPHYPWARKRYAPHAADLAAVAASPQPVPAAGPPSPHLDAPEQHHPSGAAGDDGDIPGGVGPSQALCPMTATEEPAADGISEIRHKLLSVEPGRRRTALLVQHCRELAAGVLGGEAALIDPAAPLATLGFDSRKTLELRTRLENSLQVALPATLGWRFPTIDALVPFLSDRMEIELDAEAGAGSAQAASQAVVPGQDEEPEVGELSESQIEALLMAKIEQLDEGRQR